MTRDERLERLIAAAAIDWSTLPAGLALVVRLLAGRCWDDGYDTGYDEGGRSELASIVSDIEEADDEGAAWLLAKQVRRAVLEEREACARLLEPSAGRGPEPELVTTARLAFAAEVRARRTRVDEIPESSTDLVHRVLEEVAAERAGSLTAERLAEIREIVGDEYQGTVEASTARELLVEVLRLRRRAEAEQRARSGAHALGMLGAALAAPAATERAALWLEERIADSPDPRARRVATLTANDLRRWRG